MREEYRGGARGETITIRGGRPLRGDVRAQGAKNSVLPILAACLLARGEVVLCRCPRLLDVEASRAILHVLGCRAEWQDGCLVVDTSVMGDCALPSRLTGQMRSSVVFLGAMLARCGSAVCAPPGGCPLGARPIDLHLAGLRALGAQIEEADGLLRCAAGNPRGGTVRLAFPSVGATENLILAACGGTGTTVLQNAAREPEIADLQDFLNACGGRVRGAGSDTVTVEGGRAFHGCEHTIMPDRVAAATWLCAAAGTGGDVYVRDARERDLSAVTDALCACGCTIAADSGGVRCAAPERLRAAGTVTTAPYPGFPTDAQPLLMAAVLRARGRTTFEETLFENRYAHAEALRRMGARIVITDRVARVDGVASLHGTAAVCPDLRGGAALCLAGAAAEGETVIGNLRHIDRGYEDIVRDLRAIGAEVRRA